ncbi:DUF732 domain-containing protein [Antrihabitans spumae]|jgi:hypothetical protein|uniref:DUF732 domain-containing protein n=1 Tax=Antrihabitans spumae TaxID=3373370 RepID=A0ABW7KTT1_9NOCA
MGIPIRFVAAAGISITVAISAVALSSAAPASPPDVDPWVQGQIDSLTENVPAFIDSINRSGVDRGGIDDNALVIKGHLICDAIYSHRGDLSSAMLPNTRPDDFRTMEVVAGASIKYLCPPAAAYASPHLVDAAP